jgi:hypothetical protein
MKKLVLLLLLFAVNSLYAQSYNVTFKVDMSVQMARGIFASSDKVTVKGNFNSWSDSDPFTASGTEGIYELTVNIPTSAMTDGKTLNYKFFSNNLHAANGGWETIADNRTAEVTGDVVLSTVFFNNELKPSGAPHNFKFSVDMRLPLKQGALDPSTGKVWVAGDFTTPGWGDGALAMTSANNDSIYSVTTLLNSGTLMHYKYIYGTSTVVAGSWEQLDTTYNWTGSNRAFYITDTDTTTTSFWQDANPNVTLADGTINFQVDLSVLSDLGAFDPSTDSLRIRGVFNKWNDSNPAKSFMNQDPIIPTNFYNSIPFVKEQVGAMEFYKFKLAKKNVTGVWAVADGDAQYERPLFTGGTNRSVLYAGNSGQNTDPAITYFDDIQPEFIIPAGTKVTAQFAVDMTNALDESKVSIVFDPAQDSVYLVCGMTAWAHAMGGTGNWKEDGDRVLLLTHSSGNIYTGSLEINGPAFNGFMYTYEFSHQSDGSLQKERTDLNVWSRHVRYIPMTGPNAFVQPYTAKIDHYTFDALKPATEYETWPDGLVSVRQINTGIPEKYTLNQNYPNPFNPTTQIRFSIPQEAQVSLKIFNILGQEVATLVNEKLKAGSYTSDFNASKISSGVYFYRIEAGTFSMTKKMIFLK